ncbi:MAG: ABC transporter permease subunit [Verrucomicrobiales bacterium]|nr:ABC transporter permease subunit [Verrucomicrobiales bacterium]
MIRFFGQRLFVLLVRLVLVAILLVIAMELGYGVLGNSDFHVWEAGFADPVIPLLELSGSSTWDGIIPLMKKSMLVAGLAWGATVLVGYSWGILAARLRRFKGHYLLLVPWLVMASVPGFWWVIQVAIFSYFEWERPGFANEIVVESGPDLMQWWNAVVVALPLSVLGVSVQMRNVSERIHEEAGLPFVRGLHRAGYSEGEIFYKNILRRLKGALIKHSDDTLPLILGGLIFVEVAFRFEGMGSFLIRSLQSSYFPGIFVTGLWMAGIIGLAALIRETIVHSMGDD